MFLEEVAGKRGFPLLGAYCAAKAAVDAALAALPERQRTVFMLRHVEEMEIHEIAGAIDLDSPEYRDLYRWVHRDDSPVDAQFAATLYLYEYARGDDEFRDRIVRFWAGDKLSVTDIRRRLREHGAAASYRVATVREADLCRQRFRFVSRLVRAAGHRGWLILFDEVELIGRYTIGQRAKSYVEVARWVRGDREDPNAPIGTVLATVDDYETQVLVGKNDTELIPKRLRALGTEAGDLQASLADTGMRIISHEQVKLQPPAQEELDRTYARLQQIHGEAFGWDPPAVPGLERLPSNRMRQYVRAWINEWDLLRLDPGGAGGRARTRRRRHRSQSGRGRSRRVRSGRGRPRASPSFVTTCSPMTSRRHWSVGPG